jgi:hypothetical protein
MPGNAKAEIPCNETLKNVFFTENVTNPPLFVSKREMDTILINGFS